MHPCYLNPMNKITILALVCTLFMATPASAGWVLYDDFDSGIDAEKWAQFPNSGTITAQSGQLWLSLATTDNTYVEATAIPANARGIRFEIESMGGSQNHDVMAFCQIGTLDGNVLWANAGSRTGASGLFTVYEVNQATDLYKEDLTATFGDTSEVPGAPKLIELLYNETAAQATYTSNGETNTNLHVYSQTATLEAPQVKVGVTAHADSWSTIVIDNVYYYVPDGTDYLPALELLLMDD